MNRCVLREMAKEIWKDGIVPGCAMLLLIIPVIAAMVAWEYIKEYGSELLLKGIKTGCLSILAIVIFFAFLGAVLDMYKRARKHCGLD